MRSARISVSLKSAGCLQCGQSRLTSRCAMIARTEEATRNGCIADVHQARHGRGRVVRVQRAEDEVAREAGVGGDGGGLEIANLTDHDDVRRLAQNGTKRGRESHADVGIHLHLVDAVHLILDRLFHRDDLCGRVG